MEQSISEDTNPARKCIIYFALSPDFADVVSSSDLPVRIFDNYLEYARIRPDTSCFVVGTKNINKASKILRNLRADLYSSVKPVFLLKSLGETVDRLSDGIVHTLEEAFERAMAIDHLLQDLDQKCLEDPESASYRLIGYLHTRQGHILEPYGNWGNEKFYNYPLADAILEPSGSNALLQNLIDRKLLEPTQLVDRLRHCPQCDGTHLNYVDICPNCSNIDISQKPFLHCYTCGNVSPEEKFLTKGILSCPNCATRLRHIGADYDRPLENYICNACNQVFIEPDILARCMHCQTKSAPEDLIPQPVYSLQLTERGKISAKTGDLEDVFSLLDRLNNVSVAYFESILDWLISLCRRHKEEHFSLIGIRIRNIIELTDKVGRGKVTELMDEFVRRVRELVRSTDLTARTNRYTLWLLLPKTDVKGNEVVLERIYELKSKGEAGLDLATTSFHAPTQAMEGETAKLLIARLEGEISE